jgi:uncharacterized heparinase superfamily protein
MTPPQTSRWARTLYLLRYHRADQMWLRVRKLISQRLSSPSLTAAQHKWVQAVQVGENLATLQFIASRRIPCVVENTAPLTQPIISFLGQQRAFRWPIDWSCQSVEPVSHLWRFQLHYQDALWPLTNPGSGDFNLLWKHVADWAQAHPSPRHSTLQDAWHPFCLSRRVSNWMQWWSISPPPESIREQIRTSLATQVAYLSCHLEWDLRGNHLLFNLWAIALGGAFFATPSNDEFLSIIDNHLPGQIAEQIVPGGEHFERATAYHLEAAELFLDLRDALKLVRPRLSAQCGSIAAQMTDLAVGISHPDGDPPLFGDSTLHARPILDRLKQSLVSSLDTPPKSQARARMYGDYWVWRHGDDCLIFDTGPVGADELPAHAHCDLLGFEASIGGQKLFIDSGISSYEDDPARQYCRSTAAHNCLEVDGISQCDVWGKFRMGYRGHTQIIDEGHQDSYWWCHASHDAYRRLGVPVVARHFECREDGIWSCMDVLWGSGEHVLVSRLHLHPNVAVVTLESPWVELLVGGQKVRITFGGAEGILTTRPGQYCPEFGQVIPNTVLEWTRHTKVPAVVQWTLERVPGG